MTPREVDVSAVWYRLDNLLKSFSASGLNAYTGNFPNDFYGKLGEPYFNAVQDTRREIELCMSILKPN